MESAHSHHHHLHDQLVGSSASSLPTPSCYGVGFAQASTPPSFLSTNGFTILNSREDNLLPSHYTTSMSPDLGFNWANNSTDNFTAHPYRKDLEHSSIKEELADLYYHKYTQISESNDEEEQTSMYQINLRTKLLMNKIPSSDLYTAAYNGRGFCQILPSVDAQSHHQWGLKNARAMHMNLEAVDLLAPSLQNQTGVLRDGFSFGFDRMQQSLQVPFHGSDMVSSLSSNAAIEAKRDRYKIEPRAQIQNAPKKSRLEARSSCPPFKVRKEKLGERIAALQQLVAPFGKTDTATVLMEAIGYIKFLQNQVETLIVPYMKASRNKPNRVTNGDLGENENEEPKRDLKIRGLCLVPLSYMSYITDGGDAAVPPPPHFGGAT